MATGRTRAHAENHGPTLADLRITRLATAQRNTMIEHTEPTGAAFFLRRVVQSTTARVASLRVVRDDNGGAHPSTDQTTRSGARSGLSVSSTRTPLRPSTEVNNFSAHASAAE